MGLAEPRKRLKISHDPRNLTWSASPTSVGHRLMQQQGWSAGQSLGARSNNTSAFSSASTSGTSTPTAEDAARLAASRVGVLFKDDTLGLGAKLSSKNFEAQRTGLDAFQGLLGRLNSKSEEEVKVLERKGEDRKLEVYARGRWGGMVFVPGGVLVQGEGFRSKREAKEAQEAREREAEDGSEEGEDKADVRGDFKIEEEELDEKTQRRRRKEERRKRREEKTARKAAKATNLAAQTPPNPSSKPLSAPDEPAASSSSSDNQTTHRVPTSRRKSTVLPQPPLPSSTATSITSPAPLQTQLPRSLPANGRAVLRNRNIAAKRKAFQDVKGLDAIFMRS